jgi:hypothetical protein
MRKLLATLMIAAPLSIAGTASAQSVNVEVDVDGDGPRRIERRLSQDDFDGPRLHRRAQRDLIDDNEDVRVVRRVERRYDTDIAPVVSRRIVQRRVVVPPRMRTVCRTVVRERIRPSGVVVRRPVEICREVVAGRRVFVD